MKQVLQSARTGSIEVAEVPAPRAMPGCVLVRIAASLVSAGTERASVAVADGSVTVSGKSDYMFEPFTGPDGSPTTVRGAMFAFAPEYEIGKTTGKSDAFGLSFDSNYGESAQFEYSTEATGVVHPRA